LPKKHKKNRKILPSSLLQHEGKYKIPKEKPQYLKKKPIFAFNYYADDDKDYSFRCINNCRDFWALFRNLKHMSALTWDEIKKSHQFHAHEINWNKKTLPKPIKKLEKNPEIGNLPLCQFKAFDESRIIGLFNYDCVFEIIMVDKHKTYPS